MPPRHLKSVLCASVALPAWMLGHNPGLKVIVASYGEDIAREHAAGFGKLVESPIYRRLFPATRINPRRNRIGEISARVTSARRASDSRSRGQQRHENPTFIPMPVIPTSG